jgi:hypothetical protein
MELSPSWEPANCAPTQELPNILWNPKIHYRVHMSPPLVPILSRIDLVHTTPSYLLKYILTLSTHLRLGRPNGLFPSGFPAKILYSFVFSPIRVTCPANLIFLDLIISRLSKESIQVRDPSWGFVTRFLQWVFRPTPNSQAGGPSVIGCPRLLLQYISSYPPHLEAVSSIRNLRTRHAVVIKDSLNTERTH